MAGFRSFLQLMRRIGTRSLGMIGLSVATGTAWAETGAPIRVATFFVEFMPGLRAIAEDYEVETGIPVQVQGIPYPMHKMWVRTQFLSENPPDLLILEGTEIPWQYGQSGLLQRMDPLLVEPNPWDHRYGRWGEFFDPALLQSGRDPTGALWALPFTQFRVGFFYNRTSYDELGLTYPETWSALKENFEKLNARGRAAMALAIKANDAQSLWMSALLLEYLLRPQAEAINIEHEPGWRFNSEDANNVAAEVISLGERIVAFERGHIDPARAPAFAEVARLMKEFSATWRPDFLSLDGQQIFTLFAGAQVEHMMNGTWYVRELGAVQAAMATATSRPMFDWGIFPFPELEATDTDLPLVGSMPQNAGMRACILMAARENPAAKERANRFVQYLTSPEVAARVFELGDNYDPPALRDVAPRPELAELVSSDPSANLGLAVITGYDVQSISEFWNSWQKFLAERTSKEGFLSELSASHRRSLERLASRHLTKEEAALVEDELGRSFP